jgi:hypothetical protein
VSRGTPSSVTTPYRSEAPEPLWLLHLETGGTPADVRYANFDGEISWGGQTWSHRGIQVDDIHQEGIETVEPLSIRLADGDSNWKTLLDGGAQFEGTRVRLYRTDRDVVAAGGAITEAVREDFFVESVVRIHGAVELRCRPMLAVFSIEVPLQTVTRTEFPGIPRTAIQ